MDRTEEIKKYEEHLRMEELAEGTVHIYLREAERLEEYLSGRNISKNLLLEYKKVLLAAGNRPATVNLHIVAADRYLKYLGHTDCRLKTLRIQAKHSLEQVLTTEEYQALLDYAKQNGKEKYYLILRTMAMTGIRVSELQFFTAEILEKKVIMVTGKQKTREICVPEKLAVELKEYCEKNGLKEGCIFYGKKGKPISRIAVYKMLVKMADALGIEKGKVHPHSLRHLFAVTYMERYGNLFELADLLGHSSLETTRIYARSTAEKKRQKINELGL